MKALGSLSRMLVYPEFLGKYFGTCTHACISLLCTFKLDSQILDQPIRAGSDYVIVLSRRSVITLNDRVFYQGYMTYTKHTTILYIL